MCRRELDDANGAAWKRERKKGKVSLAALSPFASLAGYFLIPVAETNWFGFADSFRRANCEKENCGRYRNFYRGRERKSATIRPGAL